MGDTPLPRPESERLAALVSEGSLRLVYGLLYRRREHPPTAAEISAFLQAAFADTSVSEVVRGLREYFDIAVVSIDEHERYQLRGWVGIRPVRTLVPISSRLRAQALASGRCGMCGKTPVTHGVVLEASLRIPPEWGGANDPENLWPLCQDCYKGRREYLRTFAPYEGQISHAASLDEPQRRIGELLKAFEGDWVPSELIGVVASAKEYQEDYQRRIRDLRYLGWDIKQQKRYHEGARVKSYYRLVRAVPWPDNIRVAIADEEKRRRESRGI
jgi:hypothetical protein